LRDDDCHDDEPSSDGEPVVVGPLAAGLRLDRFLCMRFPSWSRSFWHDVIRRGGILLERQGPPAGAVHPSRRLLAGDVVVVDPSVVRRDCPHPFDGDIAVLFANERFVAADKPPGLLTHPAGLFGTGSLVCRLKAAHGMLHICGRLDRFTSGVVLCARTKAARADFDAATDADTVEKQYLALVDGHPSPAVGDIDAPVGSDTTSPIRLKMAVTTDGRPSRTSYRVIATAGPRSLLLVTLHTGRKHQIRVHLAHRGWPVVGDKLYGPVVDEDYFTPGRGNLHAYWPGWRGLHCYRRHLPAGLAGPDEVVVEAPPSGPFAAELQALGLAQLPLERCHQGTSSVGGGGRVAG